MSFSFYSAQYNISFEKNGTKIDVKLRKLMRKQHAKKLFKV